MAHIPESRRESEGSRILLLRGLERINQGKVRDTFRLPDRRLLLYTSDRVSIFDYVLDAEVADKGRVLNHITNHNLTHVLKGFKHHLLASGNDSWPYLPTFPVNSRLWERVQVVKELEMVPLECIVRGYITGSGFRDYLKTGEVCGIKLPTGLKDADRLPEPIFTPSTKSKDGHDRNISEEEATEILIDAMNMSRSGATKLVATLKRYTLEVYRQMHEHGLRCGIIVADTKCEFGFDADGVLTLGDEVVTPDSSRNWLIHDWCLSPYLGKPPSGYDKELLRQAGKAAVLPDGSVVDISSFKDPSDPEQIRIVQSWQVPESYLQATTERYHVLEKMWIQVRRT